jgi:hypothetical protein
VFENKVLRKTIGPKRNNGTRDWRKQHNEELYVLCSSPSISLLWGRGRERWWKIRIQSSQVLPRKSSSNACDKKGNADVHKSVHRDTIMKVTNKMQLYRSIFYS